jgi:hypothetical protein
MLLVARQTFLALKLAEEAGDPEKVPAEKLSPEIAQSLRQKLGEWQASRSRVEYRNLCVRKVELALVRNYRDNTADEFTVRVRAHAQKVVVRSEITYKRDADVTAFEEFLTFGRFENQWRLKEIVPPSRSRAVTTQENVDEESSREQLEWYYRQSRAK